jgi:prophage antirepressor-like protein
MEVFSNVLSQVGEIALESIVEDQPSNKRSQDEVKYSFYRRQRLSCQEKHDESPTSFYVWTLFVQWNDGSLDCWFRATDIADGIGYTARRGVQQLKEYISDGAMVPWETISVFMFAPHQLAEKRRLGGGLQEASKNNSNVQFLTEEGLYEVYQFAPKCKIFRKKVAKLIGTLRQKLFGREICHGVPSTGEQRKVDLAALTENARVAEKDRELAKLSEQLQRARAEKNRTEKHLRAQIATKQRTARRLRSNINDLNRTSRKLQIELKQQRLMLRKEMRLSRVQAERNRKLKECEKRTKAQCQEAENQLKLTTKRLDSIRALANERNYMSLDGSLKFGQQTCLCLVYVGTLLMQHDFGDIEERHVFLILRRQRRGLVKELRRFYADPLNYNRALQRLAALMNDDGDGVGQENGERTFSTFLFNTKLSGYKHHDFSLLVFPHCDQLFNQRQHQRFIGSAVNAFSFASALLCDGSVRKPHRSHESRLDRLWSMVMEGRTRTCCTDAVLKRLSIEEKRELANMYLDMMRTELSTEEVTKRISELENEEDEMRVLMSPCEICRYSYKRSMAHIMNVLPVNARQPLRALFRNDYDDSRRKNYKILKKDNDDDGCVSTAVNCELGLTVEQILEYVQQNWLAYAHVSE